MENVNLNLLPKSGERVFEELARGNMVIVRSKNDFLYILVINDEYNMFAHTPGAPGGGHRKLPSDEKHTAIIRKLADLADTVFMAEFDHSLNLYGVMASAEEGILSLFPGEDRDSDSDIEFVLPERDKPDGDNKQ